MLARAASTITRAFALSFTFAFALGTAARADETTRISNAASGNAANSSSSDPTLSADGSRIAFVSFADDLVAGDGNHAADVFVFDRTTGAIVRCSVASDGAEANRGSSAPVLSADGRFVAFESDASNLDVDPDGVVTDVFVHDLATGATKLVSIDPARLGANGPSFSPSISADGSRVAFHSVASNLVGSDLNGSSDVFVADLVAGTLVLASVDAAGGQGDSASLQPIISSDGNVVAFYSSATVFPDSPPAGGAGLYAKELASGSLERIDVDSSGAPHDEDEIELLPPSGISDDGSVIAFTTGLELEPGDENHAFDVYLRDRAAGTTERVDVPATGGESLRGGFNGKLTGDGRYVLFYSDSTDLVDDDGNGVTDVFLRDRRFGITTRVSLGTDDEEGSERSFTTNVSGGALAADGRVLVFQSFATEFAANDFNGSFDVFLRERCDADASRTSYGAGFPGRGGAIPTLTATTDPVRGIATSIDASNSSGVYTVGFLFLGLTRDSIATRLGGTLLLDPILSVPIGLTPFGASLPGTVPDDGWACGLSVDLQILELDPWAAKGVSFSAGLELLFGD